jgi:hypothetical protein
MMLLKQESVDGYDYLVEALNSHSIINEQNTSHGGLKKPQ